MVEDSQDLAALTKDDIKGLPDEDLLAKRLRLHDLWKTTGGRVPGMTPEDFVNIHLLVVEEMERRGLPRRTLSDLDRATDRLRSGDLLDSIRGQFLAAGDIVLREAFVCSIGSFADGRIPNDLDIMFRRDDRDEFLEKSVVDTLFPDGQIPVAGGVETVWNDAGPRGDYVPLYDLILRKRKDLEVCHPEHMIHWGDSPKARAMKVSGSVKINQTVLLEEAPKGRRFLALVRDDQVRLTDSNGEAAQEPDLEEILLTIKNPSHVILDIFWDGKTARAIDILRWWSTELVKAPLSSRRLFLEKADLGLVQVWPSCLAIDPATFASQSSTFQGLPVLVRPWAGEFYFGDTPWTIFKAGSPDETQDFEAACPHCGASFWIGPIRHLIGTGDPVPCSACGQDLGGIFSNTFQMADNPLIELLRNQGREVVIKDGEVILDGQRNILLEILSGQTPKQPDPLICPKCGIKDGYIHEDHPDTGMDEMVGKCRACGHEGNPSEFKKFQAGDGDLTQEERVAKAQALTKPYLVDQPTGKTQAFVFQWHIRGIPDDWTDADIKRHAKDGTGSPLSIHGDLRFQRPSGQDLIGWTLFTPGNQKKRDKFLQHQEGENIQVTKKSVQPTAWLTVQGRAKAQEVGATSKADAYFWIRGSGRMTYGTQKPDFHEYFLRFDQPSLRALDGRWIVREIPRPGREAGPSRGGEGATIWQMSRPKEQGPYIDTHDPKEKKAGEIWQFEPVPGLDTPREDPVK